MNVSSEMQQCIKDCLDCYQSCVQTVQQCLTKGGKHAEPDHLTLLYDCASVCRVSADWMMRGSPRHHQTCRLCAELCRECAQDCRKFAGDKEMARCAEACDRCFKSCEKMAAAGVH